LARGVFATFWILLGGISGLYLFTVFSNPSALGGQLVGLDAGSGVTPSSDATTAAIGTETSETNEQEIAEINGRLHQLTEQVASLNARFKPIEKVVGPVAALPPAVSVTTSPPGAPPPAPAPEAKPEAAVPPPPPPAPEPPAEEAKPAQAEPPKPAEAPKPEVKQAAIEPANVPKPAEAAPSEPPAVAVAPLEEDTVEDNAAPADEQPMPPAPAASEAAPAPASPPAAAEPTPTESAALDPTALPPAANDGSTRYGIEIGTVAKQDALRPLWREFLTNHAALVAGLQPRRVLAPDKKWRLIAGPFGSAAEASQACALFKKASRPCEATVYAGDSL
jgi:hypothetical protein